MRRTQPVQVDESAAVLHRAFRLRRRGELRKSMLALKQAVCAEESSARLWVHYALACLACGRSADAREALERALWLRQRCHEPGRVRTTRALLARLESGALIPPRAA